MATKLLDLGNMVFAGFFIADIFSEEAPLVITFAVAITSCLYAVSAILYALGTAEKRAPDDGTQKNQGGEL
ncbi:hypothetical protein [Desulfurispirillum indicum]|uniref:hypothetical protein n=1 Tax=Desulfurispirillum indicum TaxID=936456 RepID=UPI0012EAEE70|nr:hypothetical protein [Desulfurispirillum indicum]